MMFIFMRCCEKTKMKKVTVDMEIYTRQNIGVRSQQCRTPNQQQHWYTDTLDKSWSRFSFLTAYWPYWTNSWTVSFPKCYRRKFSIVHFLGKNSIHADYSVWTSLTSTSRKLLLRLWLMMKISTKCWLCSKKSRNTLKQVLKLIPPVWRLLALTML